METKYTMLFRGVRELPNGNILLEKRLYFLTERDIMELRKKTNWIKGAHGYFAGSYPEGGGAGKNSGLTNGTNDDIIKVGSDKVEQAKKRDHKVYITDTAIKKVGAVQLSDFSEKQAADMQECHKELLRVSQSKNDSNEVLFISNLSFTEKITVMGTEHKVEPGKNPFAVSLVANSPRYSLVYMHNHPSTNTFSFADIDTFVCDGAIKTMSVVTNQGEVYIINKTSKYGFNRARRLLSDINKSLSGDNDIGERFVKEFLKRCDEGGVEYGKK